MCRQNGHILDNTVVLYKKYIGKYGDGVCGQNI